MARWIGWMATAKLRAIRPTDYPTWAHARRELAASDYDRKIVEEVTVSINGQGFENRSASVSTATVACTSPMATTGRSP
jgi:hypothetical protein